MNIFTFMLSFSSDITIRVQTVKKIMWGIHDYCILEINKDFIKSLSLFHGQKQANLINANELH